ncbi:LapA family protein [Hydrogenophaga sp.]|uniref:LapA family protein n=1 Tax=Hydrogenophaga sp. TaxID=1904254 RepID=UPI00260D5837|nr:LapA family protein [Hydrogenophaga sp.]MDM7948962.1 LapA family protein [Hydrogenophaga sp.]
MERISHWLAWGAVAVTVLFAGLNWSALLADTRINLLVADIQAPMGLILLSLTGIFVALFFIATLYSRITGLMETRRLHKELRDAKALAEKAEGSRLDGLQQTLLIEFRRLHERINKMEQAQVDHKPLIKLDQG